MTLIKCTQNQNDPSNEMLDWDHPLAGFSLFPLRGKFSRGCFPSLDVSEDKGNLYVQADIPGLKKEDLTLNIEGSVLTIRGERKSEEETKDKNYHRVERSYGVFERSFDLGYDVDQSQIKAQYKDGVLDITLPKAEKSKAHIIAVD